MTRHSPWQAILDELRLYLPKPSFDTWLQDTDGEFVEDGVLRVSTPNKFVAEMLDRRMYSVISQAAEQVVGEPVEIRFVSRIVDIDNASREPEPPPPSREPEPPPPSPKRLDELDDQGLSDWLGAWGHHQPEYLLAHYSRDFIVKHLVRLVGPKGERNAERYGPGLLNVNLERARRSEIVDLAAYARARRPTSL